MLRLFVVFVVLIGLAGCMGNRDGTAGGAGFLSGIGASKATQPKLKVQKHRAVLGGAITVAGPKGYCIDLSGVSDTESGAFVPLGACAAISGRRTDDAPKTLRFLAAAIRPVSPDALMAAPDLVPAARRAMEDETVLAALSQGDNTAKIVTLRGEGQALIAKTQNANGRDGLAAEQWRAMFLTRGHVVGLTVSGFAGQPASEDGETVLIAFLNAMQAANPEGKIHTKGVAKFFGRLLN